MFDNLNRPIFVFDYEVFAHDWILVSKCAGTDDYFMVHNDPAAVKEWMKEQTPFLVGYNNKGYDQFIHRAVLSGATPQEIKELNDFIIAEGHHGWDAPLVKNSQIWFDQFDLMDDVQMGTSLKHIEAHLGLDIRETTVPFDIDRPLTAQEVEDVIFYCKHDVDSTERLLDIRHDYLQTKINLGLRAGVSPEKALYCTNAKLTALLLKAEKVKRNDGRNYVYPPNLDTDILPQKLLDFYETIHDETIPDTELFKTSVVIDIDGIPCTFGWGGVHGSVTQTVVEEDDEYAIINKDVSSLYPSLIELYGYLSRNVPDPELFYQIRRERIEAKHRGDKKTANDFKLPLNTVSGAQENAYNDLYDPLPARSLRISGQLFITDLTLHLLRECPSMRMLNLNTDGVAYKIHKSEVETAEKVAAEWERRTGFELETDHIQKIWIKDVNNLLIRKTDGSVKKVGGCLKWGTDTKGALKINNNYTVVKKALLDYLLYDTPPDETVLNCPDIHEFMIIAKAGSSYDAVYQLVGGSPVQCQRVNRVYAVDDNTRGTLYKKKKTKETLDKIADLPEHCLVDNRMTATIDQVNKAWYVEKAWKLIDDFIGETKHDQLNLMEDIPMANTATAKPDTTPAKTKELNIYERLLVCRKEFRERSIQQSGLNTHSDFTYYELPDIVPVATEVLESVDCMFICNFNPDMAVGRFLCFTDPGKEIIFTIPTVHIAEPAKFRMNEAQAAGAEVTYFRRYLYFLMLDICNKDELDGRNPTPAPEQPKPESKIPKTTEQRAEIKETVTGVKEPADDLQLDALRALLVKLRALDPSKEEYVQKIMVQTDSLTKISREAAETLITSISKTVRKIEGAEK